MALKTPQAGEIYDRVRHRQRRCSDDQHPAGNPELYQLPRMWCRTMCWSCDGHKALGRTEQHSGEQGRQIHHLEANGGQGAQGLDIINNFCGPTGMTPPCPVPPMWATSAGCPTAQVNTATWASGTPGHSCRLLPRQVGRSPIGHHFLAAKVMAGTAIDAILDPSIIEAAKEELNDATAAIRRPIPKGVKPAAINPGK